MNILRHKGWSFLFLPLFLMLSSCTGGGPDESEFVAACRVEGTASEAECECGAREGKKVMSANGYQAIIYEMGGKGQQAREITSAMSLEDQASLIEQNLALFDKCFTQ